MGLSVNLEECSNCGESGWGWEDDGYGAVNKNGVLLRFDPGPQTIVIQTREDGVSIDQVVLSAAKYLFDATRHGEKRSHDPSGDAPAGRAPLEVLVGPDKRRFLVRLLHVARRRAFEIAEAAQAPVNRRLRAVDPALPIDQQASDRMLQRIQIPVRVHRRDSNADKRAALARYADFLAIRSLSQ